LKKKKKRHLHRIGNSLGALLTKPELEQLGGWDKETEIAVEVKDGKVLITKIYQPFFKKGTIEKEKPTT